MLKKGNGLLRIGCGGICPKYFRRGEDWMIALHTKE